MFAYFAYKPYPHGEGTECSRSEGAAPTRRVLRAAALLPCAARPPPLSLAPAMPTPFLLPCCACCVAAAPPRASTALRPGSPPFKWPLAPVADATAPNYVAMCLVVRDQQDDIVEWVHHHLRYNMFERCSGREQGGHRVDFLLVACPGACCAKRTCLSAPLHIVLRRLPLQAGHQQDLRL